MSKFHPLRLATVKRETRDAVALTFEIPPALAPHFRFAAGQHVTLRATIDGQDIRRSYSICSAVQDGALRIAVKKSPGGVFSTWAGESLVAGDTLEVMPPLGHFGVAPDASLARHYVAFAGMTIYLHSSRSVRLEVVERLEARVTAILGLAGRRAELRQHSRALRAAARARDNRPRAAR